MKIWSQIPIVLGVSGLLLGNAWGALAPPSNLAGAIQAIQQASDPSAVVAAYANGVAIDSASPQLNEAYVARMVDLGLPELAYHQAQSLTDLQSDNGLAWGVVAYVNARRGEMPEAIAAINMAVQAAPNNQFVQRTAGEIVAWYDLKADKASVAENAREGLSKVRALMEKEPAFAAAYDIAKSAYEAQATTAEAPAPQPGASEYGNAPQTAQVSPLGYPEGAGLAPLPPYPDYYYDWGPTWVEPAPSWWWQPVGLFAGFQFVPFSSFVVFDKHDFFHHHHDFHHEGKNSFPHDRSVHHDGMNVAFRDRNHAFFHHDGKTSFFGAAARPSTTLAVSEHANFVGRSGFPSSRLATPSATSRAFPSTRVTRQSGFNTPGHPSGFTRSMPRTSGVMPRSTFSMTPSHPQFGGGTRHAPPLMSTSGNHGALASRSFGTSAVATPRPMSPIARGGGAAPGGMMAGGFHGGHR